MASFKERAEQKRRENSLKSKHINALDNSVDDTIKQNDEKLNPIAMREAKNVVGGGALEKIPVDLIDLSPYQPRIITNKVLDSLIPLAKDIERNGQLYPITLRQKGQRYELIGGERRFRAIKDILKLEHITAIIKSNIRKSSYPGFF